MSLQVWLPLISDVNSIGLNRNTVIPHNIAYYTNAKFGTGATFNGTNGYVEGSVYTTATMTYMCWVYFTTLKGCHLLDCRTPAGSGYQPMYINPTNGVQVGGSTSGYPYIAYTFAASTWYHIAVTYSATKCQLFVNGQFVGESTTGKGTAINADRPFYLGCRCTQVNWTAARINDLRIYDHTCSAKEIEEVSRALFVHYKLDSPYIEKTTNLITTQDALSGTCYNGATGKYGWGTTTDMYKTTGMFQGKFSTKVYMGTAGLASYPYVYFDPFNAKGTEIQTLSFDYYPTATNYLVAYSYNGAYNFSYVVNGVNGSATNATAITIPVIVNQWNHVSVTVQKYDTTSTSRGVGYLRIGSASRTSTTTDYWLFAHVQVENKDHETAYAGVGGTRSGGQEVYDCSGYKHNATAVGENYISVTNQSVRYGLATHFNGSYIRMNDRPNVLPKESITVNMWVNFSTWGNPISCTEGGGWNFEEAGGGIRFPVYIYNVGYRVAQSTITSASLKNSWHMLTGTMNSTNVKIYIDGELAGTTAIGSTNGISYANNYLFIAAEASGNQTSPTSITYRGDISDVRIYASALVDKQIKELYNESVAIDKSANVHAREFVELNKGIEVKKNGQLISNNSQENSTTTFFKKNGIVRANELYEY